jgi:hypothetical protein
MKKYIKPLLNEEKININDSIANNLSSVESKFSDGTANNGPVVEYKEWIDWN